jgi:terminase small subunit-like protein
MPSRTKHRSIQVPAKIGRPTKYSPEWAEGFCALIAEGQSVAEICERRDQPSQQSVYTWLRENEDFLERYARAREAQADLFFKECLEIADRGKDGENESQARIQRDRLRVDTRKWMAARLAPKKYGDHISHDVKGVSNNFQPQILIQCSSGGEDEGYTELHASPEAARGAPQQGNGNSRGGRR